MTEPQPVSKKSQSARSPSQPKKPSPETGRLQPLLIKAYWTSITIGALYGFAVLALLNPWVQTNAIYMHRVQITWGYDLSLGEQFGFAKSQVLPFYISTPDAEQLFAWHILPLGLYTKHRDALVSQGLPPGAQASPLDTLNLKLLREDPEARLLIHFHGNAGTVGASYRPAYLRSLSAGDPSKLHILTIDYRGYGYSTGAPSEAGLIADGLATVNYALKDLGIPPERIGIVGQSLGTAVTFAVASKLAEEGIELSAIISIAAFSDMREIVRTYHVGGVFPVLSPFKGYPSVQKWLADCVRESWDSVARLKKLVEKSPNLNLVLLHSRNDNEIPCTHVETLFWTAVNSTRTEGYTPSELEKRKVVTDYGDESTLTVWPTGDKRRIEQWLVNWGGHNQVVTSAGTSIIVAKAMGL